MDFAFNLPINDVSFGQVSMGLLRAAHKKGIEPCIFPIGEVKTETQNEVSKDFEDWLKLCIGKARHTHTRDVPTVKLWHFLGGLESYSEKQLLLTFYELDQPTKIEKNVCANNRTCFTSEYSCRIFEDVGLETHYVPLGFDDHNFKRLDKKYYDDDRIVFNLSGKFEKRKNHQKAIESWVKKYGNDSKYFLNCAVYNPWFKPEQNKMIWKGVLKDKEYFNVQFHDRFDTNSEYNDYLNSGDIILAMSGGEGWGLPEFQSVAMGKHAVVLNASGYKGWANENNATMVYPSSKEEVYDGKFFIKGGSYNQGHVFWFDEDDFLEGCEKAIERVKENKVNKEGLKLQEEFTYAKTLDKLIEEVKKV
jgi:glycosyltransferase involved in cell wall biosynthesis